MGKILMLAAVGLALGACRQVAPATAAEPETDGASRAEPGPPAEPPSGAKGTEPPSGAPRR